MPAKKSGSKGRMKNEETYYDLLKIQPKATVAEIVNAYHAARNAFGKDSIAAYSLFSADEAEQMLKQLEEAYQTLSNLDRRREYDRNLGTRSQSTVAPAPEIKMAPQAAPNPAPISTPSPNPLEPTTQYSGAWIREQREKNSMSLDDISRLTKIPASAIKAIESDDLTHLPTRVYLQGFVNNLMKVYRIDSKATKTYLEYVDRLLALRKVG